MKLKREIELDFVRGIAILLVLDYHGPAHWLSEPLQFIGMSHFGWVGVDIFFVLSGFLVGGLLIKEWQVRGRVDSRRFLIRRAFKIWPPYYVYLVLILLLRKHPFSTIWGNFLNIQNYTGSSVPHLWSLAVEEHFYFLLVLWLAFAAWKGMTIRIVFISMATVALLVTVLRFFLSLNGFNVYAPTHTRIDGLILGVLLAILYHFRRGRFEWLQQRYIWMGIILAATLLDFRFQSIPVLNALTISFADLSGVVLLLLLYRRSKNGRHGWIYRAVAWTGVYSYGIYIWHVATILPLIAFSAHTPRAVAWGLLHFGYFGLAIITGVIGTEAVEFPFLRLRDKIFPRTVATSFPVPQGDAKVMRTVTDPALSELCPAQRVADSVGEG